MGAGDAALGVVGSGAGEFVELLNGHTLVLADREVRVFPHCVVWLCRIGAWTWRFFRLNFIARSDDILRTVVDGGAESVSSRTRSWRHGLQRLRPLLFGSHSITS